MLKNEGPVERRVLTVDGCVYQVTFDKDNVPAITKRQIQSIERTGKDIVTIKFNEPYNWSKKDSKQRIGDVESKIIYEYRGKDTNWVDNCKCEMLFFHTEFGEEDIYALSAEEAKFNLEKQKAFTISNLRKKIENLEALIEKVTAVKYEDQ